MQKKEKEKRLAPPTAYRQKAGRVSQVYGYLVCREKKGKKERKKLCACLSGIKIALLSSVYCDCLMARFTGSSLGPHSCDNATPRVCVYGPPRRPHVQMMAVQKPIKVM